jgi:hypothetical protein
MPPPTTTVKHRKLRIAWSAACGLAVLLLITLWVRSYRARDELILFYNKTSLIALQSHPGRLIAYSDTFSAGEVSDDYYSQWFHSQPASMDAEVRPATIFPWFDGRRSNQAADVEIPYWFLALTAAALSAAALPHWRFSLRTMLIAMTLVWALLGLIVWAAN